MAAFMAEADVFANGTGGVTLGVGGGRTRGCAHSSRSNSIREPLYLLFLVRISVRFMNKLDSFTHRRLIMQVRAKAAPDTEFVLMKQLSPMNSILMTTRLWMCSTSSRISSSECSGLQRRMTRLRVAPILSLCTRCLGSRNWRSPHETSTCRHL